SHVPIIPLRLPRTPRRSRFPYPTLFRSRANLNRSPSWPGTPSDSKLTGGMNRPLTAHSTSSVVVKPLGVGSFRLSVSSRTESPRSEEHTSELQSPYDLVCRLLLEKKNKN